MIEYFTVKNYRSYRDLTELSFVASKKEGKKNDLPPAWYKEIDGKRILRLILCVGLNGTGKTKLFSALSYLRMLVISKPQTPTENPEYRPFLLDNHSKDEPTEMTISYYVGNRNYKYSIKVSRTRIEEEELILLSSRASRVYHRFFDASQNRISIQYGSSCDLSKQDQHDLEVNTKANASVLSVFRGLNMGSPILLENYDFFQNRIGFVKQSNNKDLADKLSTGNEENDARMKKLLLALLRDVETNIVDYRVEDASISISELKSQGAPDLLLKMMLDQNPSGFFKHKILKFIHSTPNGNCDLESGLESLGTLNIVNLLVVLYDIVLRRKSCCIDEIEYGIHTKALAFILKMYLTIAEDCQVIAATHDLSILDSSFLRRDAVRLFEKDSDGVTTFRKREYLHNTMSFFRTYEKEVAPRIDQFLTEYEVFEKYKHYLEDAEVHE